MALERYREKRDFATTTEPVGAAADDGGRLYVIQKHAARALHYDFRLELDGVLLSWAVPKGPSLDPRDRHLAVRVEDHPVEYGGFEGTIPKGEYGGGTVELWDRGTWTPEGDPREGLAGGDFKFTLHGEKLRGSWVLARMKRRGEEEGKENWLLIKHRDEFAVDGDGGAMLKQRPESVSTGRTIEQIAADAEGGVWHSDMPAGAVKAAKMPRFLQPELATLAKSAPEGDEWLHEIKFDGYRAIASIEDGHVAMFSRNGNEWTDGFRSVADELAALPVKAALLDGEVVVQLENGKTDFQSLQLDLHSGRKDRLLYYVFDILHLDGYDLTAVLLSERKALLAGLLKQASAGSRVRFADDVRGDGPAFLEQACAHDLEGVVSKKADSSYRPGVRGREWLKAKCAHSQEFVVVGWTPPGGSRAGFGALMLAVHEAGGELRYVGKVGSGFDDRFLREFAAKLSEIETADPAPALGLERAPKTARWVAPRYVAEVAFTEWTTVGGLRHPTFKGLRDDKSPDDVVAEHPAPAAGASDPPGVAITHPDRVFWPADGVTKRDLAAYYERVADPMLPFVLHRPVSMLRCPDGVAVGAGDVSAHCFFHKHAGADFPGPFERVEIVESEGPGTYLTITGAGSLTALAQMGVLEIHVWGSRWPDIEHPDVMVFDLDPAPDVGTSQLVEAARLVRSVLAGLGLVSFVKTTGGKGLHVVVPLKPDEGWEGVKEFAKAVASAIAAFEPDTYVSTMAKSKRGGRVFIDYLRNTRGSTFVAPFSTRAKAHPTVSVPLRWEELGGDLRPDSYTIRNLPRRLAHLKSDPWDGYFDVRQTITASMKRELGLG